MEQSDVFIIINFAAKFKAKKELIKVLSLVYRAYLPPKRDVTQKKMSFF